MATILTAAEMRALEQAAIASGEVTGLELMERAGRGVVDAILAEWPDIEQGPKRAVVLCGPGNNGGDGFVVARLLRDRGWAVEVFLQGDPERLPRDAKANHDRWASLELVRLLDDQAAKHFRLDFDDKNQPTLWIDAVFGIGLSRPLGNDLGAVFEAIGAGFAELVSAPPGKVVAVDVPSGLGSDTGNALVEPDLTPKSNLEGSAGGVPMPPGTDASGRDHAMHARRFRPLGSDLTVTFHSLKPGHLLAEGPWTCGKIVVVNIGLHDPDHWRRTQKVGRPEQGWLDSLDKQTGHKYSHGHVLLLSGGCGRGGAARLAARGALRIGAGLVTLAVPPAALQENAARLDAIMLRSVRDARTMADLLADTRYNALAAGPGLGIGDREATLLHALLDLSRGAGEAKPRTVVLDADALTLIANHPELRAKLHDRVVLTPHDGEFARLFPAIAGRWRAPATTGPAYSKLDAVRDAARDCGAVVLLKGPDTVIAAPGGRAAINAAVYDRAAPWLATAGSGDVLTGFIAGLLARGFAPFDAACTAAWLHVECARSFGPGLIAEDLPEELPKVFRALGL